MSRIPSMRHRVDHVVDPDPDPQRGELFVVLGIVGMFPRIAQIHVVADGDDQPAFVVEDAAPCILDAVGFVEPVAANVLGAGHRSSRSYIVWKIGLSFATSTISESGNTRRKLASKICHSRVPWKSSHM